MQRFSFCRRLGGTRFSTEEEPRDETRSGLKSKRFPSKSITLVQSVCVCVCVCFAPLHRFCKTRALACFAKWMQCCKGHTHTHTHRQSEVPSHCFVERKT